MSMKNSNDTIGIRTRDLPACSAVPQPTAPPRTPMCKPNFIKIPPPQPLEANASRLYSTFYGKALNKTRHKHTTKTPTYLWSLSTQLLITFVTLWRYLQRYFKVELFVSVTPDGEWHLIIIGVRNHQIKNTKICNKTVATSCHYSRIQSITVSPSRFQRTSRYTHGTCVIAGWCVVHTALRL